MAEDLTAPDSPLARDFGPVARAFATRYFDPVPFPEEQAKDLARLSGEGEVVHVMRRAGALNFFFLAWTLARRALPPLRAAIGLTWSFWSPFRRLFREGSAGEQLKCALDAGGSAVVFLRGPQSFVPGLTPEQDPFFSLVARARTATRPLFLVPELFLWRSRARSLRPGIRDFLLGDSDAPGMLLTAWTFLLSFRNASLRIGRPIDLTAFVRENASDPDAVLVRKARGSLNQHLARETRAIVGPPRKEPDRIIEEALRDRTLRSAVEQAAAEEGMTPEAGRARSARYMRQIAARYSPTVAAVSRIGLRWLFTRVHAGVVVDEPGLLRAMETAREAPLVFCPSHKSHLDYLALSWLMVERGIMPPLVAAGANLSFWPAGPYLRAGGAFFLRRTFKGDRIYAATFRAYVKKILKEGYTHEFFIEGGRSRTGKLLSPKLGMVSFLVDAFLEGAQDDVFLVPVAIDYEKIVESRSYAKELAGGEKKQESLRELLSAPGALFSGRLGRVYLSFDEPVSLRSFLAHRWGTAQPEERQRRTAIRALAQRITFGITRATTITPAALLAAALLSHRRRGITAKEAGARIHYLRELAKKKQARLSPMLEGAPSDPSSLGPVNEILRIFMEDGHVTAQVVGSDTVYTVPDGRRAALAFYKNNLLHLAVGRSFVATALLSFAGEASLGELSARVLSASKLLKMEISFPVGIGFDAVVKENVDALVEEGLLVQEADRVKVAPDSRGDLAFLRELCRDLFESYRIVASSLGETAGGMDKKELVRLSQERGQVDFMAGTLACSEALARPTLENAVAFFVEQGLLTESENGKRVTLVKEDRPRHQAIVQEIDRILAAEPR